MSTTTRLCWLDLREATSRDAIVEEALHQGIDGLVAAHPSELAGLPPSIDRVLGDLADRFGAAAGAIVFSGMGSDAVEGCRHVVARGGKVYVQSPESCVVSTMVDGIIEAGLASFQGTPAELADRLMADARLAAAAT